MNVNNGEDFNGVYFEMINDIALNADTSDYFSWGESAPANIWTPIGSYDNPFRGVLNGGGYAVSGIYIDTEDDYQGLFGFLGSGGKVENLGVIESYIAGADYVGTIAGYVDNGGTVDTCYNTGSVSGCEYVGGVAGFNQLTGKTVKNCYNTGSVSGVMAVGGVVGENAGLTENCYNMGAVSGEQAVGGVVGAADEGSAVQNCYNTGPVSGAMGVGGVAGIADADSAVQNCYNAGTVIDIDIGDAAPWPTPLQIGGVVGLAVPGANIIGCYYDRQMCTVKGIGGDGAANGTDATGCAEGKLTSDMLGEELEDETVDAPWSEAFWNFEDGLYPRLAGMDITDAAYVSATPVFLYDNTDAVADDFETSASVTQNFNVGVANDVSWLPTSGVIAINNSTGLATVTRPSSDTPVTLTAGTGGVSRTVTLIVSAEPTYAITKTTAENGDFTVKVGGTAVTESIAGSSVTLSAEPATGYSFSSWSVYKTADPTMEVTVTEDAFTMPAYPVTVGAAFTANDYTVTFDPAGGTVSPTTKTVTYASTYGTLPTPTRTDHSFGGWWTGEDGTGTQVFSTTGVTITAAQTLYAKWTQNPASGGRGRNTSGRTITVAETSSSLFSGSAGEISVSANMDKAFANSVEVRITDTDEDAGSFGLTLGSEAYLFDISLYIKGTNKKTQPAAGYAVTISLPLPENLLDKKELLSVMHKSESGAVTTLDSRLEQIDDVWYLVFEATEFSPYAIVVTSVGSYDQAAGMPYFPDAKGNIVFIGFAANGKYIAPAGFTVSVMPNAKSFTDVYGHWAAGYIGFVTEREIFLGTGSDTFSPAAGMTRAMFATVIGRLFERSYGEIEPLDEHAFTDCNYGAYYGKYVDWAAENNIIGGYGDGRFSPNDQITREQMAAILYRFADFLGVLPADMDTTLDYPDADNISGYAKNAALYCQTTGVISGRGGGMFTPKETVTRAEVATIIQRFVTLIVE